MRKLTSSLLIFFLFTALIIGGGIGNYNNIQVRNDYISINTLHYAESNYSTGDNIFGSLISSYTTYYSTSSTERKHNIKLATDSLDNTIVMPLDTLSFNTIVGARTSERGYMSANIIIDGKFQQGIGGGVCQVSSTLFNAWIMGGLDIGIALNHSLPVGYIQRGLDATVSSAIDMVLINSSTSPIYIKAKCNDKCVSFYIYGKKTQLTYAINTVLRQEIPPPMTEYVTDISLTDGTETMLREARTGYKIDCIRQTIMGNNVMEEKVIRQAYYPACSARIARPPINIAPIN